ncbi:MULTISPECIES: DUF6157 family protein [unclassified Flavobacterium]|jgi:hypothetical protein|uniref:DUF6157 family protein n=1 Tax=unclassified Flavobacterium TaxID=196869 RepID=UPI00064B5CC4|nr:DUF6157 family protein [Flavobacterium sp. ABG]KLT68042.1 hypothetical protein AB674_19490 [Flavobacterium sp. ABG]
MKVHTTNYENTFIEVAEDCPAAGGEIPRQKGEAKTIATIEFDLIHANPYKYSSDDVLFQVFADKNDLTQSEYEEAREKFFSKGQACLRASPLTKRYGWGIHNNEKGKVALYGMETEAYQKLSKDQNLKIVKAMRTSRK